MCLRGQNELLSSSTFTTIRRRNLCSLQNCFEISVREREFGLGERGRRRGESLLVNKERERERSGGGRGSACAACGGHCPHHHLLLSAPTSIETTPQVSALASFPSVPKLRPTQPHTHFSCVSSPPPTHPASQENQLYFQFTILQVTTVIKMWW